MCGVNGKLYTAPQGQAVRDDFYASLILADGDNIEILQKDLHRNSCARLPAYSSWQQLVRVGPRMQYTRAWASGKVLSEGIMWLATPASRCCEQEWQA